jgi:hypothetical protein
MQRQLQPAHCLQAEEYIISFHNKVLLHKHMKGNADLRTPKIDYTKIRNHFFWQFMQDLKVWAELPWTAFHLR